MVFFFFLVAKCFACVLHVHLGCTFHFLMLFQLLKRNLEAASMEFASGYLKILKSTISNSSAQTMVYLYVLS